MNVKLAIEQLNKAQQELQNGFYVAVELHIEQALYHLHAKDEEVK